MPLGYHFLDKSFVPHRYAGVVAAAAAYLPLTLRSWAAEEAS